ncbi:nicotinate-nucleotide adenylyltransferase [Bartonella sp. DGB2]|uniref:nicotinate-nucleotide adenylyltransferase n=1 Tax=Bartonella sp. DGB2 TaxID=3388426 RepID=UPI00398FCE82
MRTDTAVGRADLTLYAHRPPYAPPGAVVGLFGGSFNPPHAGHVLVAKTALRVLRLKQLWWMVSRGNPLKDHGALASLEARMVASCAQICHPKVRVTGFEAVIGSHYSFSTLVYLKQRYPLIRFVWIMGSDSLAEFHHWKQWQRIIEMVPVAIIDRPSTPMAALSSPMAQRYQKFRLLSRQAPLLGFLEPPAWVYLYGSRSNLSSSLLRDEAWMRR